MTDCDCPGLLLSAWTRSAFEEEVEERLKSTV